MNSSGNQTKQPGICVNTTSFQEAATIFGDEAGATVYDPDHSEAEDRFLTIGYSNRGRLLIVSHTDQGNQIRIISARPLEPFERRQYE